jgi:hypothetical protein
LLLPQNGSNFSISRHAPPRGGFLFCFCSVSPFFEIASLLVRFDHVASFIVDANHRIM